MAKVSSEELVKVTLLLFKDDYEQLIELSPRLGVSGAIRILIRKHLATLDRGALAPSQGLSIEELEEMDSHV